jgi:hypothetical protein
MDYCANPSAKKEVGAFMVPATRSSFRKLKYGHFGAGTQKPLVGTNLQATRCAACLHISEVIPPIARRRYVHNAIVPQHAAIY